jgi:hypothetical protein
MKEERDNNLLPILGNHSIKKKDARICFLKDDKFRIKDFRVYECANQADRDLIRSLIKVPYSDYGNAHSDWDEWSLQDVILAIFKYPVPTYELVERVFQELYKIEEWSEYMEPYFHRFKKERD